MPPRDQRPFLLDRRGWWENYSVGQICRIYQGGVLTISGVADLDLFSVVCP